MKKQSGPFNIADAYAAFTCDVVYDYAFGFNYGQTESEGFQQNFSKQFAALTEVRMLPSYSALKTLANLYPVLL